MARLLIYLVGVLIFVVAAICGRTNASWFSVTSAIAVGFSVPLIDALIASSRWLRIAVYAARLWNKDVRISAAYLFQIKVDNQYLLIKGNRFNQYQPVGGVYKTHASFEATRQSMNILDDHLLVPDAVSEKDLRIRVKGAYLYQFVQWFESERNRETDCWREFYEELVDTKILPVTLFRHVKYDRVRRRYSKLRYSKWAKCHEILISDIVELIPTDEQLSALRTLKLANDDRLLWSSEDQIVRLGATADSANQTTRIAETAVWAIDKKA